MSITDELRELTADPLLGYASQKVLKEVITAIADRIDAEHEEAIQQALMDDGGVPATDENMAEYGWVKLPVDANGETIRLGDDMETLLVGHEGEHSRVEWISLTEDGWEVDGEPPTSMCHYHAHTVEDVLREFVDKWMDVQPCREPEIIAEYAKRLRLAGDVG